MDSIKQTPTESTQRLRRKPRSLPKRDHLRVSMTPPAALRLRVTAAMKNVTIGVLLTELVNTHLPPITGLPE